MSNHTAYRRPAPRPTRPSFRADMVTNRSMFSIMFKITAGFIILTFVAAVVMIVLFLSGNFPVSYSYNYQVGNVTHSESFTR